jgi:hypothetical protein
MRKLLFFVLGCVLILCWTSTQAEIPRLINYQGMLTDDGGNPLTGSYDLTFYIYDDTTGGNLEWSEVQNGVQVQDGLFNVVLGKQTALNEAFDESYWLAVKVGTETMPRMRITSVGYAYRAAVADSALNFGGWTDDGSVVNLTDSTDSVGIGTSTPWTTLHVRESIGVGIKGSIPGALSLFPPDDEGWYHIQNPGGQRLIISGGESPGDHQYMTIRHPGNVGLGTLDPGARLHVSGSEATSHGDNSAVGISNTASGGGNWYLRAGATGTVTPEGGFSIADDNGYRMAIDNTGNVGIGTTSPDYKLDVNGDINISGSYNVKKGGANYTHPDYVFEPEYDLMSLDELRKHVAEKKCLPNVISAEDVKKNEGFKMDELLIQMLEKIEEQTLYIFQLEERIAKLEEE